MSKKRFLSFAPLALLLFVAACGAIPGNDQVDAGITKATVEVCQTDGKPYFCGAEIIDGKEKQAVSLAVTQPDGWTVNYSASEVKAFDGQKIRGAVEQAISSDIKEAFPDIVEKITKAIIKTVVP
jgi:hypothetical protein